MAGKILIIVLSVMLLLAVGVLVVGVGRIVYGIIHYYVRERQPVREVRHPEYGCLTGEGELWTGTARADGRQVRFTVSGTDLAPDDALLNRVGAIFSQFAK